MLTEYNQFSSFICQKVLPLVYDESLSYYEVLTKLSNYVNEMVTSVNTVITANNSLAAEYQTTLTQLAALNLEIENMKQGFFIENGSIGIEKMSTDLIEKLQEFCVEIISNIAKFVWFGLNDEGYFIAIIPSSWEQIDFSTDENNNLVLKY